jgi:rhodanese-related sulfurtransferase
VTELSVQELTGLVERGEAELVDVRTDEEHSAGHIPGDRHVPIEGLAAAAEELDAARQLVFYYRVGNRSLAAAQAFTASGREAHSLAGGIEAWVDQGQPIEPEDGSVVDPSGLPPR